MRLGNPLEEPDVGAGAGELDVAQALAADAGQRDFHAALVANHPAVLHALVFAAQAFPVLRGTEDACAEQAVALRLEGPVIDGLRLGYFAIGPASGSFPETPEKCGSNQNPRSNSLDRKERISK